MADLSYSNQGERRAARAELGPQAFARLREFSAGGYVPVDDDPDQPTILLRHPSAPDMILHPDGSIDLPLGQPAKQSGRAIDGPSDTARLWRLGLMFLILSALLTFVAVFLATLALDGFGRP